MSAPKRAYAADAVEEVVIVTELLEEEAGGPWPAPSAAAAPGPSANTLSPLLASSSVMGGSLRSLSGPGPGPSKHIHVVRSGAPAPPKAHCHRHIDTVFVVIVLLAMLILVIAECISMNRF